MRVSRRSFKVGDPQVVEVSRAIVHPGYGKDSHGITLNDLVLLKLRTPVTFGPLVQLICLPTGDELDKGISTVMGWAVAQKNAPDVASQNHLQWADLDFLSDGKCIKAYKTIDSGIRLNPSLHLCAGRCGQL